MLDKKLIYAVKRGDEKAFRVMFELYFSRVVNYAAKLLHSREDAREVAQDVFMKLWAKRYELDVNQSVSGLIFRITKCLSIDRIRMQESAIKTSDIAGALDVEDRSLESDYLHEELRSVYVGSLQKLPRKRRMIFHLSRNRNLSYKEIARRLNISTKTVEAQIRLALQQIRQDISKYSAVLAPFIPFLILLIEKSVDL